MPFSDLLEVYDLAKRDRPATGITSRLRPAPNLDEARIELSRSITEAATMFLEENYRPVFKSILEPVLDGFLKNVESSLSLAKGNLTIVVEELLDRSISKKTKVKE